MQNLSSHLLLSTFFFSAAVNDITAIQAPQDDIDKDTVDVVRHMTRVSAYVYDATLITNDLIPDDRAIFPEAVLDIPPLRLVPGEGRPQSQHAFFAQALEQGAIEEVMVLVPTSKVEVVGKCGVRMCQQLMHDECTEGRDAGTGTNHQERLRLIVVVVINIFNVGIAISFSITHM